MHIATRRAGAALLLSAALAACDRGLPLLPNVEAAPPVQLVELDCTVQVAARSLRCARPAPQGPQANLIVGGQGEYVNLQGTNIAYSASDSYLTFDVTVQNLIPQALGTTDGAALHSEGVQVFFYRGPTAAGGSGAITVMNPKGTQNFLDGDVPYYQWDEVLSQNETSSVLPWEFNVPASVTSFAFKVYVRAAVQFPDGWVAVTTTPDTLVAGATASLSASVLSVVGKPVAGQTVTWASSNTGIATVDAAGTVTAVAAGTTTITAQSGARTGVATMVVCPNLAMGDVYTAEMPVAGDVCLAGGASGAEYTYIPVNLSSSSALALDVTAAGIIAVTGPPSPSIAPGGPSMLRAAALRTDEDVHARMMEADLRAIRGAKPVRAGRGGRAEGPSYLITKGTGSAVGDLMQLNTVTGCSGTRVDRTGQVMSVGTHIIIVADTTNPAGGFTTAQYDSIANEFDTQAYPVVGSNFGTPTDLDSNGKVVAFYTRAVNELSPPNSSSIIVGYVTARDLFSSAATSCPLSNEGEMFYMLAPDPNGEVNGNVRTVATVRQGTVGTLAHEFQHLINASRRIYLNGTWSGGLESVWLNEGLSHIAEELMFYNASGLSPRGNIGLETITASNARINAYNLYSNQNVGRLRQYLLRPDTSGAFKANDVLATRGAVWAFLRYAADRRDADDQALWQSLVNTQASGTANLQAAFGTDPLPWVRDFTAAIYADDAVADVSPQYEITSWNWRSLYTGIFTRTYPLLARPLTNGVADLRSFSAGGGSAHYRLGVTAGAFAGVTARSSGALPTSPYALIVVRTK